MKQVIRRHVAVLLVIFLVSIQFGRNRQSMYFISLEMEWG